MPVNSAAEEARAKGFFPGLFEKIRATFKTIEVSPEPWSQIPPHIEISHEELQRSTTSLRKSQTEIRLIQ